MELVAQLKNQKQRKKRAAQVVTKKSLLTLILSLKIKWTRKGNKEP